MKQHWIMNSHWIIGIWEDDDGDLFRVLASIPYKQCTPRSPAGLVTIRKFMKMHGTSRIVVLEPVPLEAEISVQPGK